MSRVRELWRDVWPASLVAVPGFFGTGAAAEDESPDWSRDVDVGAYLLVAVATLAVTRWRRRPELTLTGCGAAVATYLVVGYPFGPLMIASPVAAYAMAHARPAARAIVGNSVVWLVILMAGTIRYVDGTSTASWYGWLAASFGSIAIPTAIAAALRIRRESEAGVRSAQARRAVSEERLRMAHELHDSVGHGLAVIAMQAGVALHVLDRDPAKVREALEAIRSTSRESLNGLRAELQVLRAPVDDAAPRRPTVGLAELDVLFDRIRAGGVEVIAEVDTAELSTEADVAAYRILQEALTNVLRHSGATRVWVRIRRDGDHLVLDVVDDGSKGRSAGDGSGTGWGIAGMRTRAAALGGSLDIGPRPTGGFAVRARLPVAGSTAGSLSGTPPATDVSGSAS